MAKVKIYSKNICPYCVHAKNLLETKGQEFEEINVDNDYDLLDELIAKTKMRTVPQIFIDDLFVGGFSELSALNESGELDKLLAK